jgi:hypothetical protein
VLKALSSISAGSGLAAAITDLCHVSDRDDIIDFLEDTVRHEDNHQRHFIIGALVQGLSDNAELHSPEGRLSLVLQQCIERWSLALPERNVPINALVIVLKEGLASPMVLERLWASLRCLPLCSALRLAAALFCDTKSDFDGDWVMQQILSVLQRQQPESELLNAALEALNSIIQHPKSDTVRFCVRR